MGRQINIIICIVTVFIYYKIDSGLVWVSLVVAILIFLSSGIMHNLAMQSAKEMRKIIIDDKILEGASRIEIEIIKKLPIQIKKYDLNRIPDWLSSFNMISSIAIYILLIIAIVKVIL